jgi:hypothetical protein
MGKKSKGKKLPDRKKRKKTLTKDIAPQRDGRKTLRGFDVEVGLGNITAMRVELQDMVDVLTGRVAPPIDAGLLTLMEVADAYYARASEMTMLIQRQEADADVGKGSLLYKFRTGELRTFRELAKAATDLGSRRLTKEQLMFEQSRLGRDSRGSTGGWDD